MMSNLFNLIHLNKALKSYSELCCAPMEGLSSRKSNLFFKGVNMLNATYVTVAADPRKYGFSFLLHFKQNFLSVVFMFINPNA